ncbi:DUF3575 domain-containing protein [Fulvivirgaceae bacterium BMA10]|uniref:DUF3575 domain-containing protein n=1 Tax=Splendidivirga corallicola TaxID=3051826 RepID=A0ABT8KRX9_9BACT|nr:DUF3575 domain-containing protein [Fulvivirgaceae bacterium BMA10]
MKQIILCIAMLFPFAALKAQEVKPVDPEKQKKKAIKMEFFSPLSGNLTLGYEQYIKNWVSFEGKLGLIGVGTNISDQKGLFIKAGPKFKLKPDFITDNMRGSHFLRGSYIKPELVFSFYNHKDIFLDSSSPSESVQSGAIILNYGKQYILGEILTIDWSFGFGYGFDNNGEGGYHYGHTVGSSTVPIAATAGFTVGLLLR